MRLLRFSPLIARILVILAVTVTGTAAQRPAASVHCSGPEIDDDACSARFPA